MYVARSSCNLLQSFGVWMILYKIQSSANKYTVLFFTLSGRSFINSRKSTGPNAGPWGTPEVTDTLDNVALFTTTL